MRKILIFHVITLFPEAFESYLKSSIVGRAIREKKIAVKFYNPRDFVSAPHSLIVANGGIAAPAAAFSLFMYFLSTLQ